MNRKELVRRIAGKMRENNMRKQISMPRHVFHISDDEGNSKDFVVRKSEKSVLFTVEDIDSMLEACLYVIGESLKRGEQISIMGFGTLGLRYHKPKIIHHVETGEEILVPERYQPKFTFGNDLRMCAKVYELSLKDQKMDSDLPTFNDQDGEE